MNHWAHMLQELPTGLQRLIARTQRISLPRACSAAERHARLRAALCSAATVRATYTTLDSATQAALQDLRARRGGVDPGELERLYGPVRSITAMQAEPSPQSIAERLLLLGWLLPRPAAPRHPPRYLLPPELRSRLPQPLEPIVVLDMGAPPPIVRAATTLLLCCAEHPQPLRDNGSLRTSAMRALARRLAPLPEADAAQLLAFTLPLLLADRLLTRHAAAAALAPAGRRFLALAPTEQRERLRDAWRNAPHADPALVPLIDNRAGIDWPYLRRRLCVWAAAFPAVAALDPQTRYQRLAAAFGPLADAHTHGFRRVDRAPWQPRRAAAIFDAALRGPLQWLGYVTIRSQESGVRSQESGDGGRTTEDRRRRACPERSEGTEDGGRRTNDGGRRTTITVSSCHRVIVSSCHPLTRSPRRPLTPAPAWSYGEPGDVIIPHNAANADILQLLSFAVWHAADADTTTWRITTHTLARARSRGCTASRLRTLLEQHAGVAPVAWEALLNQSDQPDIRITYGVIIQSTAPATLQRALQRRSLRRYVDETLAPGVAITQEKKVAGLIRTLARERIAYTIELPDAMPTGSQHEAGFCEPPAINDRTGVCDTPIDDHYPFTPSPLHPFTPSPLDATRRTLQSAIAARQACAMAYYTAGRDAWTQRTIRSLRLEQRGADWYLHAYCLARQAERVFRLDRIGELQRVSSTGQVIERIGSDPPDADNPDPSDGRRVEQVTAHTVGIQVDDCANISANHSQLLQGHIALEHAILHPRPIPQEQLHDLCTSLILDHIVTD
jgi:hypothetical protein